MYNRYVPQSDGSYRRNRMAEPEQTAPSPKEEPGCPPPQESYTERKCSSPPHASASGFLRNLIPKNMDTGDLLIILLLLIMAGDCADDQNSALLTLALYLFL